MDPQESKHWKLFINLCLILLILLVLGDFLIPEFMEYELGRELIEIVELFLSLILLMDISISFVKAKDRKTFLKKNFIRIIAVFPWGFVFKGFALLRLEAEIPIISEFFLVQSKGLAAQKVVGGAGKSFRL